MKALRFEGYGDDAFMERTHKAHFDNAANGKPIVFDLSSLSEHDRGEVEAFADYMRRTAAAESAGVPRDEAARAIYPDVYAWTCHAKPATTGKTCGHVNAAGIHYNGNLCCEACGCTKVASDAREKT